ncbi:MAG: DUF2147 domain-containing protein [Bradyrhizobium sp.]|nr:DUF2147 domain-containing protein [Bradyrhizobium sp.]
MKRLLAMAIVLLASSAAQAQYQFEYGGRTIRIDPDRGTVSIPGVYDNSGKRSKRAKSSDQDTSHSKPAPQDARAPQEDKTPQDAKTPQDTKADPQAVPPAPAPADTAAAPPAAPAPATTTATNAPTDTAVLPPPPPPPPPPASTVAAAPAQTAPASAQRPHDPNSPVGVWLTEEKEGKVRIEQCGANLCGYSVDAKSNANGEQVLINMKPGKDQKWSGRILDPNTGSTYDSTIAMKGTDTLRVQGCAFGGMFCGGQTWSRVN